jgi:hypothetical protein
VARTSGAPRRMVRTLATAGHMAATFSTVPNTSWW